MRSWMLEMQQNQQVMRCEGLNRALTRALGRGTGGSVCDIDGDGVLEVLIAHGESAAQPLTLYKAARTHGLTSDKPNNWLRVQLRCLAAGVFVH